MQYVEKIVRSYRCSIRGKPSTRRCWMFVMQCQNCAAQKVVPMNLARDRQFHCSCGEVKKKPRGKHER